MNSKAKNRNTFRESVLAVVLLFSSIFSYAQLNSTEKTLLFQRAEAGDAPALATLTQYASGGDVSAQVHLARMNQNARGLARSESDAIYWYRRASENGSAYADNQLGILYCKPWDVLSSHTEAEKWRRKAAEHGNSYFQYDLARDYEGGKHCMPHDYKQAMQWYLRSADQGNYRAQRAIGIMYSHKEGVSQDLIAEYKAFFLARAMYNPADGNGVYLSDDITAVANKMSPAQLLLAKEAVTNWVANHSGWEWCDSQQLYFKPNCPR